ncbi:hypothetical protein G7046_g3271 [Stylonectria norvegica]|nr:hypothetical protein G7046_g3271 [Stylonectria norvegica]
MGNYAYSLSGLENPIPPENEFLYRTKPLPPPPLPAKNILTSARYSMDPPRAVAGRKSNNHHLNQRPLPLVLPASRLRADRMSLPSHSITGRRSSQKLHPLTVQDVGSSHDYLPLRRIVPSSSSPTDSSSNFSYSFEVPIFEEVPMYEKASMYEDIDNMYAQPRLSESSALPPPLEPDCDGTSSKRSSGAPKSPRPVQFSPPAYKEPVVAYYSSAPGSMDHVPGLNVSLNNDDSSWRASRSYNYFSDVETADEYHRITTDLATRPNRDSVFHTAAPLPHCSLSSRLSVSAKVLFSRKRDTLLTIDPKTCNRASFASGHHPQKTPYPPAAPLTPEMNVVSPPRSVFETDDEEYEEDEDHKVRVIKEFFARRSEDRAAIEPYSAPAAPHAPPPSRRPDTPRLFSKTGGQTISAETDGSSELVDPPMPPPPPHLEPEPEPRPKMTNSAPTTRPRNSGGPALRDLDGKSWEQKMTDAAAASIEDPRITPDELTDADIAAVQNGIREALTGDSVNYGESSLYYDSGTMAPLNAFSAAAIARFRTYKPPAFPLWDRLPARKRAAVLILLYADKRGDLRVVITMRATSLRSFSGHAAFPGGKADDTEETPYQIARREAWEEIGLPMDDYKIPKPFRIEHLCSLPPSLARTHLVVRPVVAYLSTDRLPQGSPAPTVEETMMPKLDAREVAAVFSAPFYNFLKAEDLAPPPGETLPPGHWYDGEWMAWKDHPWRIHNFYVPVNNQTVSKPRRSSAQGNLAEKLEEEEEREGRFKVWGMTARVLVDAARIAYAEEPEVEHNDNYGDESIIEQADREGDLSEVGEVKKEENGEPAKM